METSSHPRHELIYAQPRVCHVGFDFGNTEEQCGFLEYLSRNLGRGGLQSYLEVCSGPAYHMSLMAGQGVRAYGIDFSAPMITYAKELVEVQNEPENGEMVTMGDIGQMEMAPLPERQFHFEPRLANLCDFSLGEAVDLAFCPRNGLRYLLKNEDIISHLVSMAKNLGRGGLYVLEMFHPSELFSGDSSRSREWTNQRDGLTVKVKFQDGEEQFDPINQIVDQKITMLVTEDEAEWELTDRAPVRLLSYQELRAIVQLSGVFDWVATFGDLAITQQFDNSPGACCMVPVLRCSV